MNDERLPGEHVPAPRPGPDDEPKTSDDLGAKSSPVDPSPVDPSPVDPVIAEALLIASLQAAVESEPISDELLMAMVEGDRDDPAWATTLLDRPELRADIADIASAVARVSATAADEGAGTLAASVRQAALKAFDRAAIVAESPAGEHAAVTPAINKPGAVLDLEAERAFRSKPKAAEWTLGWRAVAAVLLVAFGVTIVALSNLLDNDGTEAEAGLRVATLTRHDGLGNAGYESGPIVRIGEVFAPSGDQVITFGFGNTTHVVVSDGDRLRVASGEQLPPSLLARVRKDLDASGLDLDLTAVLRLESGEALLDAGSDDPVLLAVGDDGLLAVLHGACHVAIDPGAEAKASGPAVALRAGGLARFYRASTDSQDAAAFDLAGPTRVLLAPTGPTAYGSPAASLFRDLEMFGGDLYDTNGTREYRVRAALWRLASGPATRRGERFRVPVTADAPTVLAWRPVASLSGAHTIRIALRGPAGMELVVGAQASGADAFATRVVLTEDTRDDEPGLTTAEIALPDDWLSLVAGGELTVEIRSPKPEAGAATDAADARWAWFDGVAFVIDRHAAPPSGSKTNTNGAGR